MGYVSYVPITSDVKRCGDVALNEEIYFERYADI